MAKTAEKKMEVKELVRISGVLCIICAAVALVLSLVNILTADRIAANEENEKRKAIVALFGSDSIVYEPIESVSANVNEILTVKDGEEHLGYSVSASPAGFGGGVNIMVGIGVDGVVMGVRIVSHSETPGLGSRVQNDSFLNQFNGKEGSLASGQDYDIISGSTISSQAVAKGVSDALSALAEVIEGGVAN